uniref:PNK FHA domain-containing protein n=1 Tax=Seriola dumerili TaxID=41447 RepID=A0A3B4UVT2_SERDU
PAVAVWIRCLINLCLPECLTPTERGSGGSVMLWGDGRVTAKQHKELSPLSCDESQSSIKRCKMITNKHRTTTGR